MDRISAAIRVRISALPVRHPYPIFTLIQRKGKITLNAIDVIFRRKGKVGQTLNLRRDQARNFSEEDRAVNRDRKLHGWLVPHDEGEKFRFYNYRNGKIEEYKP